MEITKYIKELLLAHDSVALPELGTFKLIFKEAEIKNSSEKNNKEFAPPHKSIVFDINKITDDEVVSTYISSLENIDQEAAEKRLSESIKQIRSVLAKGERVAFDEVGFLFYDQKNILQFEADEDSMLLNDSFGLSDIKVSELEPSVVEKDKEKNNGLLLLLLILLPLVLLVGFFAYKTDYFRDFSTSNSDIISANQNNANDNTTVEFTDNNNANNTAATDSLNNVAQNNNLDTAKTITENNEVIAVVEEDNGNTMKKFYLVVGSFSIATNAEKLKADLKSKGFNTEVYKGDGYNRVTINGQEPNLEGYVPQTKIWKFGCGNVNM